MGKYIEQYKQMYYRGDMLFYWLGDICKLIDLTEAKSLLDFGCGQGKQYSGWGDLDAHNIFLAARQIFVWSTGGGGVTKL